MYRAYVAATSIRRGTLAVGEEKTYNFERKQNEKTYRLV